MFSSELQFMQFHPELNPIERCWGWAKKYARSHCDYSFPQLQNTVPRALAVVSLDLIRKYFRKVRDYHRPTWRGKQQLMQWMQLNSIGLIGEFQTQRIDDN